MTKSTEYKIQFLFRIDSKKVEDGVMESGVVVVVVVVGERYRIMLPQAGS